MTSDDIPQLTKAHFDTEVLGTLGDPMACITMTLQCLLHKQTVDLPRVSMTPDQARQLSAALLQVADRTSARTPPKASH